MQSVTHIRVKRKAKEYLEKLKNKLEETEIDLASKIIIDYCKEKLSKEDIIEIDKYIDIQTDQETEKEAIEFEVEFKDKEECIDFVSKLYETTDFFRIKIYIKKIINQINVTQNIKNHHALSLAGFVQDFTHGYIPCGHENGNFYFDISNHIEITEEAYEKIKNKVNRDVQFLHFPQNRNTGIPRLQLLRIMENTDYTSEEVELIIKHCKIHDEHFKNLIKLIKGVSLGKKEKLLLKISITTLNNINEITELLQGV